MKRMNLLWADGIDVHYPTDEPNLAHVENSDQENRELMRFVRFGFLYSLQWPLLL